MIVEPAPIAGLYLLHFEPAYWHARHYLGFAVDVRRRVHEHAAANGRSSPLVRAHLNAGGRIELARVWAGGDRTLERHLKNQHNLPRYCPTCQAAGTHHA